MIHMVRKMAFHDACMQLCLESNFAFAADQMHEKFNASSVSTFSGLHRLLKVEGMLKTFKNQKNIKDMMQLTLRIQVLLVEVIRLTSWDW